MPGQGAFQKGQLIDRCGSFARFTAFFENAPQSLQVVPLGQHGHHPDQRLGVVGWQTGEAHLVAQFRIAAQQGQFRGDAGLARLAVLEFFPDFLKLRFKRLDVLLLVFVFLLEPLAFGGASAQVALHLSAFLLKLVELGFSLLTVGIRLLQGLMGARQLDPQLLGRCHINPFGTGR